MIRLDIINDGTGNEIVGNYDALLYLPNDTYSGYDETKLWTRVDARVEHHTRSNGWGALVHLAVQALSEQMKGGESMTMQQQEQQEVTIRFSATGSDRSEVLRNVKGYLNREGSSQGLTMQSIELNGEEISSDEIQNADNENDAQ